jgi:hypothetical protein
MSSEINNQSVNIQQLVTPEGINIATGSPSLSPINGALAMDSTQAGILYIGNGSTWNGIPSISDSTVTGITLTQSGQPNVNATLYLQKIVSQTITMVYYSMDLNWSSSPTASGTWETSSGTVPTGFTPATGTFASFTTIATTEGIQTAQLTINTAGLIKLIYEATPVTANFTTSGIYFA